MDLFNLISVAAVAPKIRLADPAANAAAASVCCREAAGKGVDLLLFPDLSLTGSTCGDLFGQPLLLTAARDALNQLVKDSSDWPELIAVVGLPASFPNGPGKATAILQNGALLALFPQPIDPAANRSHTAHFPASLTCDLPAPVDLVLSQNRHCRLCFSSDRPGSGLAKVAAKAAEVRADLLLLQSSAPSSPEAPARLARHLTTLSELAGAAILYSEAGAGESSSDIVLSGQGLAAEVGELLWQRKPFAEHAGVVTPVVLDLELIRLNRTAAPRSPDLLPFSPINADLSDHFTLPSSARATLLHSRPISPHPFIPKDLARRQTFCRSVLEIQAQGLAKRLLHLGKPQAIIGISGGLDSTLALIVACRAYDILGLSAEKITGVSMPGFGTSIRTRTNAHSLMAEMGIQTLDISITEAVSLHFKDIGHDPAVKDITYENAQARERTQILMDLANRVGGLVIGTGDLSELALGWCTYNGDQMSMYGVNAGVPKTLIRHILQTLAADLKDNRAPRLFDPKAAGQEKNCRIADLLEKILATPISPELLPPDENGEIAQHTEDSTGPYELHDFFIYYAVRQAFSPAKVYSLAKIAFAEAVPEGEGRVAVTAYDAATIKKWLGVFYRRFFSQQFKRSALPDGPQIFDFSLAARGDRVLPADAHPDLWLNQLEAAAEADLKP